MKISDYVIIYLIIVIPLLVFTQWRAEDTSKFEKINTDYDKIFNVAVHDAVDTMKKNATPSYEYGYSKPKFSRVNKEVAYDSFIRTLALNFGTESNNTKDVLERYVPVFSVVEYDGFSMSVYDKFQGTTGLVWKRVWQPKIPFTYSDKSGNIVQFTLDDYVKVYDVELREWVEGYRKEVLKESKMELLKNKKEFEQVRRSTVVNTVQDHLAYQVNKHNVYTRGIGITYKFAMPLIDQDDWYNTIQDVGVLAFMQGYPYQRADKVYNQFAYAGGKLSKREVYYATVVNGKKVFYSGDCNFNYTADEIYQTKKEAVSEGYYELSCLNR